MVGLVGGGGLCLLISSVAVYTHAAILSYILKLDTRYTYVDCYLSISNGKRFHDINS